MVKMARIRMAMRMFFVASPKWDCNRFWAEELNRGEQSKTCAVGQHIAVTRLGTVQTPQLGLTGVNVRELRRRDCPVHDRETGLLPSDVGKLELLTLALSFAPV